MKYIISENQERKLGILNKCWYSANIGDILDEDLIYQYVKILHRNEDDFYEGDIVERIEKFNKYKLKEVPISDIETDEFQLDDDYVDDYIKKYKNSDDYPPIILDGEKFFGKYSIISII